MFSTDPKIAGLLALVVAIGACDDDDGPTEPMDETTTFAVEVANVSTVYEFSASGSFAIPVGKSDPGPLLPGDAYEFEFSAAPGSYLSFATMFVHSNDLFYAPDEQGIALFDGQGNPVTGNVTGQVDLWDSGTEVNQEPGLGEDQAPRQSGPDTGADDPDDSVRLADDEFGNLPPDAEVIRVTLESLSETRFRARIENVSDGQTLQTSDGSSLAVPLAPGAWVVHSTPAPLFTAGEPDRGEGLEAVAEDGVPTTLAASLEEDTGLTSPLAPGVYAVHSSGTPIFESGTPDRGEGLEALAEDGVPGTLAGALQGNEDVDASGAFTTPDGESSAAPAFPGESYSFEVTATPGDRLSLATMLVQSNDLFYAFDGDGVALFTASGTPRSGDLTGEIALWDAGTEVNEKPGVGLDQAPRQAGPDTGPEENGTVRLVDDGYEYPPVAEVIRVTLTPVSGGM